MSNDITQTVSFEEFQADGLKFFVNQKAQHVHATKLCATALTEFHAGKFNVGFVVWLHNQFLNNEGSEDYVKAFEHLIQHTTSIKLSFIDGDMAKGLTGKTKGNIPTDGLAIIHALTGDKIRTYMPKSKTKARKKLYDNDFIKAASNVQQSAEGTSASIRPTDMGQHAVDAMNMAEGMEGAKADQALAIVQAMQAAMEALNSAEGEEIPELPDFSGVAGTDLGVRAATAATQLHAIAVASSDDTAVAEKLVNILKFTDNCLPPLHALAIATLAKSDQAAA